MENELAGGSFNRKWVLIILISAMLGAVLAIGAWAGRAAARGEWSGFTIALVLIPLAPLAAYAFYRKTAHPYYRRLEDANLELHIKQEELLDTKDDLFIKFLGIYDVNYAANSPRLFMQRLNDVADITTRVMEADRCLIFLYDKKKDVLTLAAANEQMTEAMGKVRIPLGEGIEGWVGRRLDPVMLKDIRKDSRWRDIPGLDHASFQSVYCLPLYVYANGALMGVIEVLSRKGKTFREEEINFFTTLAGILSTTIQNEQMHAELRKMNMELEQWVAEKTEELRASEERYRTLVENSSEAILVLSENGDIVFANEQAAAMTGWKKYDLIHKSLFDIVAANGGLRELLRAAGSGGRAQGQWGLRKADAAEIPAEIQAVGLTLIGRRFVQCVIHDMTSQKRLETLLAEREREIARIQALLKR